jgi:transposase
VQVGRAKRRLSAFVMTLSYSRALYVELFFDQTLSNFLAGHQRAFESFGGVPRQLLCDNLRSVVLERRGELIRFHPRYLELAGHYCFQSRPCNVRRGNEKGRVERSIRYLRESFWPTQSFTTLGVGGCEKPPYGGG